jgi:hypothetical protein
LKDGIATIRLTSIAPRPPVRIQIGNPIIERLSGKSACPVIELPSLKRMSETTGEEAIRLFVDYIRQKIAKFNLPARLKDLSLSIEQLSLAVEDVRPVDIVNNLPRSMTTDDIFDFVKNAY